MKRKKSWLVIILALLLLPFLIWALIKIFGREKFNAGVIGIMPLQDGYSFTLQVADQELEGVVTLGVPWAGHYKHAWTAELKVAALSDKICIYRDGKLHNEVEIIAQSIS